MRRKKTTGRLFTIDTQNITLFTRRLKKKIAIPESILEEHSLENSTRLKNMDFEHPPLTQYQNAEGYEFNWGNILERRVNEFIVWDYHFDQLLTLYLRRGKRLSDMQYAVFKELEKRIDCATRDIYPVLSMADGWKIIPCSAVGVFTQVIHFTEEEAARQWTQHNLLHTHIPVIIDRLQQDVLQGGQ